VAIALRDSVPVTRAVWDNGIAHWLELYGEVGWLSG